MLYNRGYGSVEYRSLETVLTLAFSTDPPMTPPPPPQVVTRHHAAERGGRPSGRSSRLGLPAMDARGRSEFQVNGVAVSARPSRIWRRWAKPSSG